MTLIVFATVNHIIGTTIAAPPPPSGDAIPETVPVASTSSAADDTFLPPIQPFAEVPIRVDNSMQMEPVPLPIQDDAASRPISL